MDLSVSWSHNPQTCFLMGRRFYHVFNLLMQLQYSPVHDQNSEMTCVTIKASDQHGDQIVQISVLKLFSMESLALVIAPLELRRR